MNVAVDDHRAEEDVVGLPEVVVAEPRAIEVDELEFPLAREHGGDREEAQRWKSRLLGDKPEHVFETPKGVGSLRTDQQHVHKIWLCYASIGSDKIILLPESHEDNF